jgi:TATA-binding protein-associated factor Taf7
MQVFDSNESFEKQIAEEAQTNTESGEQDRDLPDNMSDLDENEDHTREKRTQGHLFPTLEGELSIPNSRRNIILKKLTTAIPWKSPEEFEHISW